jgi:hypothetical protein
MPEGFSCGERISAAAPRAARMRSRRLAQAVLRPVYCEMTVTTGMSISGKMSVGIERKAVMPRKRISKANT